MLISYLNEDDDAQETARLVTEAGRRAVLVPGDISEEAHCRVLVQRTVDEFGRVDLLINNAAFQRTYQGTAEITSEEWDYTFRTNIHAMFYLAKAALPHMQPGGAIINTTSIQSYQPDASLLAYATTKGAITNFTKALAEDVAKQGIRANAVASLAEGRPFDLVVSNPPYIPTEKVDAMGRHVAEHEPRLALDGGQDGLDPHRRILAQAPGYLTPGGRLFLEHKHYHGSAARALAEGLPAYEDVRTFPDANKRDRALYARRK